MKTEKRTQLGELRADEDGKKLIGYAAVFNKRSEDLGGFVEVIEPGAFSSALDGDVRALWNHDSNIVLGRTLSGTLALSEDDNGLRVEITPPETGMVNDYMESVRRGDVSQMSFMFSVRGKDGQSWDELEDGSYLRTLRSVNLFEVSPVTFSAYHDTSVAMRSMPTPQQPNHAARKARMRLGLLDKQ